MRERIKDRADGAPEAINSTFLTGQKDYYIIYNIIEVIGTALKTPSDDLKDDLLRLFINSRSNKISGQHHFFHC